MGQNRDLEVQESAATPGTDVSLENQTAEDAAQQSDDAIDTEKTDLTAIRAEPASPVKLILREEPVDLDVPDLSVRRTSIDGRPPLTPTKRSDLDIPDLSVQRASNEGRPPLSPTKRNKSPGKSDRPPLSPRKQTANNSTTDEFPQEGLSPGGENHGDSMSWKEDRFLKGGIHARPDVDGDSSDEDAVPSISIRGRARAVRIRRLQQTSEEKRFRSRTTEPRPRKRNLTRPESTVIDSLDLQLIEMLRPEGAEYGPDEGSL